MSASAWPCAAAQPLLFGLTPGIDAAWLDRVHGVIDTAPGISQLWWLSAAALALAGVAVLVRALRGDGSGHRRCPRCRYSMSGIDTLTCPECGKAAADEPALHRPRRRPLLALLLGLPLLTIGAAVATLPALRSRGLVGSIPTRAYLGALDFRSLDRITAPHYASPTFQELMRRARSDESRPAAARMHLLRRIDPGAFVRFPRPEWVRGEPIHAPRDGQPYFDLARARPDPSTASPAEPIPRPEPDDESYSPVWRDPTDAFHPPEAGPLTVHALLAPYNRLLNNIAEAPRFQLRVRPVASVDDILTPLRGHAIDDLVAANLAPRFVRPVGRDTGLGHLKIVLPLASSPPDPASAQPGARLPTLGLRVELARHSRVVARTAFFGELVGGRHGRVWVLHSGLSPTPAPSPFPLYEEHLFVMTGTPEDLADADAALSAAPDDPAALDGWSLRLIGDGLLALRDPTATTYWAGTLEFRPRVSESGSIVWHRARPGPDAP